MTWLPQRSPSRGKSDRHENHNAVSTGTRQQQQNHNEQIDDDTMIRFPPPPATDGMYNNTNHNSATKNMKHGYVSHTLNSLDYVMKCNNANNNSNNSSIHSSSTPSLLPLDNNSNSNSNSNSNHSIPMEHDQIDVMSEDNDKDDDDDDSTTMKIIMNNGALVERRTIQWTNSGQQISGDNNSNTGEHLKITGRSKQKNPNENASSSWWGWPLSSLSPTSAATTTTSPGLNRRNTTLTSTTHSGTGGVGDSVPVVQTSPSRGGTLNGMNNKQGIEVVDDIEYDDDDDEQTNRSGGNFTPIKANQNRRRSRSNRELCFTRCSRSALLIWAIAVTTLLIVNLAVSSGMFKQLSDNMNRAGELSNIESVDESRCRSNGNNPSNGSPASEDLNTGSSGTNPAASPASDGADSNNKSGNSTTATDTNGLLCGCESCVASIWDRPVGYEQHTCGDRITYLSENEPLKYPTQVHACRHIAHEYPCDCGMCDPSRCNLYKYEFNLQNDNWLPKDDYTAQSTPVPASEADLQNYQMYCYLPEGQRLSFTNVWNKGYYIEVKESTVSTPTCGPGNTPFLRDNVQYDSTNHELKLLYRNGASSEVRVLRPDNEPFSYGTYRFEIGAITVRSGITNEIYSNILPKELVFGLFTWDDTENYAIRENYNHEVDIEISRWGCETSADVQFLVQPPGFPQMHRFYSSSDIGNVQNNNDPNSSNQNYQLIKNITDLQQQNHLYEFTWAPGKIDWYSTAGGEQQFTLKTVESLYMNIPDYVQCMPDIGKQTEVRINLWYMKEDGGYPVSFESPNDVVEVTITNFEFIPYEGVPYVQDGDYCSKQCQCNLETSTCAGGICTAKS